MTSSGELASRGASRLRSGDPVLRVVFRAPAGSRRGFGHLVRCLSLARALGVRPLVALRGNARAMDVALGLGADLLAQPSCRRMQALDPDVVVIDDPSARQARRWVVAARRAGALVVTIHDLGLGCADGDVVIDGSAARTARGRKGSLSLAGPRFAVLDPRLADYIRGAKTGREGPPYAPEGARTAAVGRGVTPRRNGSRRVLIALGGGPHTRTAESIAEAILDADPNVEVRIAGGFVASPRLSAPRLRWVGARSGLAPELAAADVAIVGGGVSLYEACALGVPAVALAVVNAQRPTIQAFADRGAALALPPRARAAAAAAIAVRLLNDPDGRAVMARRSRRLVDGRGASRAAAAVMALSAGAASQAPLTQRG